MLCAVELGRACRVPVSQATFMAYFWPLYTRVDQVADDEAPKPAYFRFLTLLGGSAAATGTYGLGPGKRSRLYRE